MPYREFLIYWNHDYKKGLTYDELVNVLDEIHIYKNLIKGTYDRSEKYVKRPWTRKRKPRKYLD